MKKYYKVVTQSHKSCVISTYSLYNKYCIQYKINEFVNSKLGLPLYVFDNLNAAKFFANYGVGGKQVKIYECEVTKPRKIKYLSWLRCGYYNDKIDYINKFLLEKKHNKKLSNVFQAPNGTIAVDSVKLVAEIK